MDLTKHKDELFESFTLFSILLMILVVFATTVSTQTSLLLVIIAFLPTIAVMVITLIIYEESKVHRVVTWIIPFILAGVFFFTINYLQLLRVHFDIVFLTFLNVLFSVLYLGIGYTLLRLLTLREQNK